MLFSLMVASALAGATPIVFYVGDFASPRKVSRLEARLGPAAASLHRLGGVPTPRAQRRILRTLNESTARFVPAMALYQSGRLRAAERERSWQVRMSSVCHAQRDTINAIGFVDTSAERVALFDALIAASECIRAQPDISSPDPFAARAWEMANQQPTLLPRCVDGLDEPARDVSPRVEVPAGMTAYLDGHLLQEPMRYGQHGDVSWETVDSDGRPITGGSVQISAEGGAVWRLESLAVRGVLDAIDGLQGNPHRRDDVEDLEGWLQIYAQQENGPFYLADDRQHRLVVWSWSPTQHKLVRLQ
ncbi:MAG: hypothetical protein AAFV53_39175 [Myxococcota bacterium]